jgi:hypothetical protein
MIFKSDNTIFEATSCVIIGDEKIGVAAERDRDIYISDHYGLLTTIKINDKACFTNDEKEFDSVKDS